MHIEKGCAHFVQKEKQNDYSLQVQIFLTDYPELFINSVKIVQSIILAPFLNISVFRDFNMNYIRSKISEFIL